MAYFRECPRCGANLDPGEICDCIEQEEERKIQKEQLSNLAQSDTWIQLELQLEI